MDVGAEGRDFFGGEEGFDHGALAGMGGGVHVDEGRAVFGSGFSAGSEFGETMALALLFLGCQVLDRLRSGELGKCLRETRIGEDGADVLVLCNEPWFGTVEELNLGDRVFVAEVCILWRGFDARRAGEGENWTSWRLQYLV